MRETISVIFQTVDSILVNPAVSLGELGLRAVVSEYPKETSVRWVLTHRDGEESTVTLSCAENKSWTDTKNIHLDVRTSWGHFSDKWFKDIQSGLLGMIDSEPDVGAMFDRTNIEHPINWGAVMASERANLKEFTSMLKAPIKVLHPLLDSVNASAQAKP